MSWIHLAIIRSFVKKTFSFRTFLIINMISTSYQIHRRASDNTEHGFVEIPSSLNVTEGEQAVFQCNHSTAHHIGWIVNDTTLSVLDNIDITTIIIPVTGGGLIYELAIQSLGTYNQTRVKCLAFLAKGQTELSPQALLLIQGPLGSVNHITRRSSLITWDAPFSLDLTNTHPDIAYCVDIFNITCGSKNLIISDCYVFEDSYNATLSSEFIHEINVSPRSNVAGSDNGTTATFNESFVSFNDPILTIKDTVVDVDHFIMTLDVEVRLFLEESETDNIRPTGFVLSTSAIESELNDRQTSYTSATIISMETRRFTVLKTNLTLPLKQLWDIVILSYGCEQNALTTGIELSTHEIQQLVVTSTAGGLTVSGQFIEESKAVGILAVIYSPSNDSSIHYGVVPRMSAERMVSTKFDRLSNGPKSVSLFVMENNGLPYNRIATKVKMGVVDSTKNSDIPIRNNYVRQPSIEYSLQSTSTGVCITCTFLDSSATDCVAVVHQRISQLIYSGLMNIESSHKFTRSGDTASGCIEGVNFTEYQFGIIGAVKSVVLEQGSMLHCSTSCLIGAAIGVTVVVVATILMVIITFTAAVIRIKQNGGAESSCNAEANIKTSVCAAYEMTSLAINRQCVPSEESPAYEEII